MWFMRYASGQTDRYIDRNTSNPLGRSNTKLTIIIPVTMFIVLSWWQAIVRVYPVHLVNADSAPGGRQPSDQANRLGLWVRW